MKHERSTPVQRCIGQVRSLCYLLDEPTTTITIPAGAQTITAYASGQVALDLRALPCGATICVMLRDVSPDTLEVIAFRLISPDQIP